MCKRGHGSGGKSVRTVTHQCVDCAKLVSSAAKRKRDGSDHPPFISQAEKIKDLAEMKHIEAGDTYYDDLLD